MVKIYICAPRSFIPTQAHIPAPYPLLLLIIINRYKCIVAICATKLTEAEFAVPGVDIKIREKLRIVRI
jgi:hypothetical protein